MQERYVRNMEAFSAEELATVRAKNVLVVGCGGLGGHVIQSLARFGVGKLTLMDGDAFAESNLNRQVFATADTLGHNKALATQKALADINPDVAVDAHAEMLTEKNAVQLVQNQDIAIDCLDNVPARFTLAGACSEQGIPLVHGAIGGFYGQVANILPGEKLLERLYPSDIAADGGVEKTLGNPPFIPQMVGAVQSSEALKLLAGRTDVLRGGILHMDMLHNNYEVIRLL